MPVDSITAQKRLIEAGIGIALLPESSIHEELRLGTLRTIDVSHLQTNVPIHVLYRKNGYLTGASRTLLALISNVPVGPSSPARQNRKEKMIRRRSPLFRHPTRSARSLPRIERSCATLRRPAADSICGGRRRPGHEPDSCTATKQSTTLSARSFGNDRGVQVTQNRHHQRRHLHDSCRSHSSARPDTHGPNICAAIRELSLAPGNKCRIGLRV